MGIKGRTGHAKCNYCRLWVLPYHAQGRFDDPATMLACQRALIGRFGLTRERAIAFLRRRLQDFEYPPYRRMTEYKQRVAEGLLAPTKLPRQQASLLDYGVTPEQLKGRDNHG